MSLIVLRCAAALTIFSGALLSQADYMYYKFDEAGGKKVINYASASMKAPAEGSITSTDVASFEAGKFGAGALRGSQTGGTAYYTFVESGGHAGFTGSFTVAWFMRERVPVNVSNVNYYFGSNTTTPVSLFRGYSSGNLAGPNLLVRNWGGNPADLKSVTDIHTASQGRWLHVALVVDGPAGTATFYMDGVAEPAITVTGQANVVPATSFRVNSYTQTAGNSVHDMDEFRLLNRAATAVEILAWSRATSAADARFGAGCGGRLSSSNGPPLLGNPRYLLDLGATAGSAYVLSLGFNRLTIGPVPLPFDLGAVLPRLPGCNWESSMHVLLAGAIGGSGSSAVNLPIPPDASLEAAAVYAQALFFSPAQEQSSNPFAISIGR